MTMSPFMVVFPDLEFMISLLLVLSMEKIKTRKSTIPIRRLYLMRCAISRSRKKDLHLDNINPRKGNAHNLLL